MDRAVESSRFLSQFLTSSGLLRRPLRGVALVSGALLAVTVGQPADAAAAPKATVSVKPAAAVKVTERPDGVSAGVTARAQGSRVEIVSERTEFTSTWANPDGTRTTQAHAGQIRFRDKDRKWQPVDLGLQELTDGSVAAKAHLRSCAWAGRAAVSWCRWSRAGTVPGR
ncbi:hypothetical protein ACQP1U_11505 [Actinomycetota bacterium]